jgi:serine/threonine protein kinase
MAPEQLLPATGHSYEADVWALGVNIYCMLTGETPFVYKTTSLKHVYKNIAEV